HLRELLVNGRLAVELDGHFLADDLDGVDVEAVLVDELADDFLRGLPHHAAELLAVEAAPVLGADVALRPLDGELLPVEDLAADLHAAVALALLEPDLELHLEVLVRLLAAQERVELQPVRRGADEGAVLVAPVLEPFPPAQVLGEERRVLRVLGP